jgi:pimeloyl-ACP methyl ester carboxylesterase
MIWRSRCVRAALICLYSTVALPSLAQESASIASDPAQDKAYPAAMQAFQLPSHGALLNALVYVASGAAPHPTVILLHGFPGNERNLDLAQSIRRAGWDVLYFDYRGSWGSAGDFSFSHCIEDTQAAIAYLREPANAVRLRADLKTIVLVGHSMGGFMAIQAGALDPDIRGVVAISASDLGAGRMETVPTDQRQAAVKGLAARLAGEGMAPLAGTGPEKLANEVLSNAGNWNFVNLAPKLATRPLLVITSDDGLASIGNALADAVGQKAQKVHMATDHSYSDHRIALQRAVIESLSSLNQK